jgi:hypothetical protein
MPKKSKRRIVTEVKAKIAGYSTAGLGLIAGLAWNEAIKELIIMLRLPQGESVMAKFLYAIIMTILVALAGVYLAHALGDEEEEA